MKLSLLEAETKLLAEKYINLTVAPTTSAVNKCMNTSQENNKNDNDSNHLRIVNNKGFRRRPQPTLVVGNFQGQTSVEGVEKKIALHVNNLKPGTTAEELQDFLSKSFPEVLCESLRSRYPESYSSFKVTLSKANYEKALLSNNWPNRACVRYFLQRKQSQQRII